MIRSSARGSRVAPSSFVWLAVAWLASCGGDPLVEAPPLPVDDSSSAPADPSHVVVAEPTGGSDEVEITPAFHRDEFVTTTPVRIRRVVYRFALRVPFWLGRGSNELSAPTGELTIDVAGSRLRAHFEGTAFPVDENAEVRVRADEPGSYVFDARGGRPYGTGQLAAWFQSGPGARGIDIKLRAARPEDPQFVDLVCRLFGEWAGASIAGVRYMCSKFGLPIRFVFGPYYVERTAESILEAPETTLRSDELDPPPPMVHEPELAFWEPRQLAKLTPSVDDPPEPRLRRGETRRTITEGLYAENRTAARVLVTIDGVALGWLDSGRATTYSGIVPGGYHVGAMLPLGNTAARARPYRLPAHVVLER